MEENYKSYMNLKLCLLVVRVKNYQKIQKKKKKTIDFEKENEMCE